MIKRVFSLSVFFVIIAMLFNNAVTPQIVRSESGDIFTPASLVKDINSGEDTNNELGSHPRDFVTFGGYQYFVGIDREHGQELWKTDGTFDGTKLVKDITPGMKDSDLTGFTVLENSLYFFARDNSRSAWGLWKSDGSVGGTLCIKDGLFISSGFGYKYPSFIPPTVFNGFLYFSAGLADPESLVGVSTVSLWRSDGTPGGTFPVMDFADGTVAVRLFAIDDTLYLGVSDAQNAYLWKCDGTSAGTSLIYTRSDYPKFTSMAVYDNELYFLMSTEWVNKKTWLMKSDGTTTGTVEIKSFDFDQSGYLYNTGTKLIFFLATKSGDDMEAWVTDGTSRKTKCLVQMSGDSSFFPHVLVQLNNTVFFATHEVEGLTITSKLYKSDGTVNGTSIIKDNFFPISGKLYNDSVLFLEERDNPNLWISNGTSSGTTLVKTFTPSPSDVISAYEDYIEYDIAVLGSSVLFGYDAGTLGMELWKSDGTEAGTQLLKNIYSVAPLDSNPNELTDLDGTLLLRATTASEGIELWRSDSTESGTTLVKDIFSGSESSNCPNTGLTTLNSTLYFFASDAANQCALWKSDGTLANTSYITNVVSGDNYSSFSQLITANNALFFVVDGDSLWRSDGTAANTALVKQIDCIENYCGDIHDLVNVNGTLFFTAGYGLWKSDGTEANTTLINEFTNIRTGFLVGVSNIIYFFAIDSEHDNMGLWRSDGTETGTYHLKELSAENQYATDETGGRLFFAGYSRDSATELWVTDGTEQGTVLVKDIYTGSISSYPKNLTMLNNLLLFSADDGIHGNELWISDGTPDGTQMVQDIFPGIEGSNPQNIESEGLNGWALFSANDGQAGYELWQSNGTEQGTMLVQDIAPGILDSTPSEITTIGEKVFFAADDFITGNELWAMEKSAIITPRVYDLQLFTPINTPISSILSAIDPAGSPLTYSLVTNGAAGIAIIDNVSTGDFTYTPNTDVIGVDSFTFQVTNGAQTSVIATVTVDVYQGFSVLPLAVKP